MAYRRDDSGCGCIMFFSIGLLLAICAILSSMGATQSETNIFGIILTIAILVILYFIFGRGKK